MKENSIEEDIKNAEHFIGSIKIDKEYEEENGWHGYYNKEIVELARILGHILSDYKRVLKELEELKDTNCLVRRYFKLKDTNTYLRKENEKYKRIAEMNLKNAEEFKDNMCEHRCLLKSENEELKEKIREHTLLISPYYVKQNFIPIQKVKDKIEKLNDVYKAEKLEDIMNRKNYTITELVQYVLQELLDITE